MSRNDPAIEAAFIIADSEYNPVDPSVFESLHLPGAVVTTHTKRKLVSDEVTVLEVKSLCDDNIYLESHIDWLLTTLQYGDVSKLEALCKTYGSMFSCAIYTDRSEIIPSAGLTAAQCREFVRLNAELDIDILR